MEAKGVVNKYIQEVNEWLKENQLTELPEYKELTNKEVLGKHYRKDQIYFENVSNFRANLFSLKSYFLKEKSEESIRTQAKFDTMIDLLTNEIYMVNNYSEAAKQRIKFYESIMYMIANMTFGDF